MNVDRLYDTVQGLLGLEEEAKIQGKLQQVLDRLTNLAGSPGDAAYQASLASSVADLAASVTSLQGRIPPSQRSALAEMLGDQFFDTTLVRTVNEAVASNVMTPSVAQDLVQGLVSNRQVYLASLTRLLESLQKIGVKGDRLPAGSAELSVLVPGSLFENDLFRLSRELKVLNDIIRPFSEIATGAPESVKVDQISSTDPTFFLNLDLKTIALIGTATTWILATIKSIQEIRRAREQAKAVEMPVEILDAYDAKMRRVIDGEIEKRAKELAEKSDKDAARQHELNIALIKAMTEMSARIERGMKIEVVLSVNPPPDVDPGKAETFEQLKTIRQELDYPRIEGGPVLSIAAPEDNLDQSPGQSKT